MRGIALLLMLLRLQPVDLGEAHIRLRDPLLPRSQLLLHHALVLRQLLCHLGLQLPPHLLTLFLRNRLPEVVNRLRW